MKKHFVVAFITMLAVIITTAHAQSWTDPYDVIWTTPSKDAAGSMPLGNGEVGINLWVEENGDLNFYISRSDSFSEISRLLKVGQVRVAISPNPFVTGALFRQRLNLHDGVCEITAGEGEKKVSLKVFVDSDRPVVHLVGTSGSPVSVKASIIRWRTKDRKLPKAEQGSAWTMHDAPFDLVESADELLEPSKSAVAWYHKNKTTVVPSTLEIQSLQNIPVMVHDPLLNRIFGGLMTGMPFHAVDNSSMEASSTTKFVLEVVAPVEASLRDGENGPRGGHVSPESPGSVEQWAKFAIKTAELASATDLAAAHTSEWWHNFWDRSYVITNAGAADGSVSPIARGYTLQRYVQACEGRGNYPIKFNGGIFTVEPAAMKQNFNPDYRAWGDGFWWQNTRHMYHPMLASGDFEMMDPLFKMYESVRPLCEARAELYHHAQGCYFPETMSIWGTYSNGDYGWNRAGHEPKDVLCPWWQYAWNQGPELVGLMLDRWDYTNDPQFLKTYLLPMAESVLNYFNTRFKKDPAGKIILDPTQSVETFWTGVINDMPTVAGLNDITNRLCNLPADLTTQQQREFFANMKAACPAVPIEEKTYDGQMVRQLAPAEKYGAKRSNCENPELYGVWPFRLYGIGKPDLDTAIAAYTDRVNHLDVGWGYDGNCAALLGLTDEAARILSKKCDNSHKGYRWPATWGPNFDWLPDQNHGGNLLETTQLMLLQCDGSKIRILPAWPRKWDVSFKLHATGNTVVECVYRAGKIEKLVVTPGARRADVIMPAN